MSMGRVAGSVLAALVLLLGACSVADYRKMYFFDYQQAPPSKKIDAAVAIETSKTNLSVWTEDNFVEAMREVMAEELAGLFNRPLAKRESGEEFVLQAALQYQSGLTIFETTTVDITLTVLDPETSATLAFHKRTTQGKGVIGQDFQNLAARLLRKVMTDLKEDLVKTFEQPTLLAKRGQGPATGGLGAQTPKPGPLTVDFRYPEDRARVAEAASVVAAVITSSKGVAKVSVTLNGAEVHQQSERTPQKSLAVTVPVTLREGANAIVVSASEPDGTVRQEIRTVTYDRPKAVAGVPAPPIVRNRWAVVIGVGRYESPAIPRLRYTVPDAEALYEVLIGPAGFKKEHVLLLTDKTEKKPTLRNIKWALGTFLARSANKEDTVVIFFAGHGAPEVDQRGVERDGLAKYLVPRDADPDDLFSTALPMDDIQTIFGRIEAERVVVFLDTCYSGAAGGRTFASKKTRASHVDDLFLERLTRSKGRAIITASRPAEVSIELPELGHGIFTYYLVQGLKGVADLNRDGIVSLQELYEYVEQQVTQKSRAVGGNQHPVMKGELEGVLPLVKLGGG